MKYCNHVRGITVATVALGLTLSFAPTSLAAEPNNEPVTDPVIATAQVAPQDVVTSKNSPAATANAATAAKEAKATNAADTTHTGAAQKQEPPKEAQQSKVSSGKAVAKSGERRNPNDVIFNEKNSPDEKTSEEDDETRPTEKYDVVFTTNPKLISHDIPEVSNPIITNENYDVYYRDFETLVKLTMKKPGPGIKLAGAFFLPDGYSAHMDGANWDWYPGYGNSKLMPYTVYCRISGVNSKIGRTNPILVYAEDNDGNFVYQWITFAIAPGMAGHLLYKDDLAPVEVPQSYNGKLTIIQPDGSTTTLTKDANDQWIADDNKTRTKYYYGRLEITNPDMSYQFGQEVTVTNPNRDFELKIPTDAEILFTRLDVATNETIGSSYYILVEDKAVFDALKYNFKDFPLTEKYPKLDGFFADTVKMRGNTYTKMKQTNTFNPIKVYEDENGSLNCCVYYQDASKKYDTGEPLIQEDLPNLDPSELIDDKDPEKDPDKGPDKGPEKVPDKEDHSVNPGVSEQDMADWNKDFAQHEKDGFSPYYGLKDCVLKGTAADQKTYTGKATSRVSGAHFAVPKTDDKSVATLLSSLVGAAALFIATGIASLRRKDNDA